MKKTIFALFAVLLVLMMATCDLFELPIAAESNLPLVTPDGRPAANLTINFESTSRALVASDAPAAADFYEVVFKDPSASLPDDYHVKSFGLSAAAATRTITIPVGDYTGDTKAVIFAGKDDGGDKILLGIGYITSVDGTALASRPGGLANTAYIESGSHTVTFTIAALESAVTTNKATSKFQILGPTAATTTNYNYATTTSGTNPTITVTAGSVAYPIFPVPPRLYANPDALFTNESKNIIGQYTVNLTAHSAAVKLNSAWTVTAAQWSGGAATYTTGGGTAAAGTGAITCTAEGTTPGSLLSIATNVCTFKFLVNVSAASGTDGLCQVLIDAPVKALAPPSPAPTYHGTETTWHIRAGTNSAGYDGASSGANTGALIILDVGGGIFSADVQTTQPGTVTW